jgi:hypothetical protein
MRLRLAKHPRHLAVSFILLGTCSFLLGTTGGTLSAGTACGCEAEGRRGNLTFLQAGVLKIPENETNTYTVEYTEFTGNSGTLTRKIIKGLFTTPGGTCGTPKNNLTNKETCTMSIKCTGAAGEKGEVEVLSSQSKVLDAEADVECT